MFFANGKQRTMTLGSMRAKRSVRICTTAKWKLRSAAQAQRCLTAIGEHLTHCLSNALVASGEVFKRHEHIVDDFRLVAMQRQHTHEIVTGVE